MTDRPLSAQRVRLLAARHRALLRTRTYTWVGLTLAAVLTMMSSARVWDAVWAERWRDWQLYWFSFLAVVGVLAVRRLWRKHIELTTALRPAAPAQLPEPDFSTLSDGSSAWGNLERVEDDDSARD